MTIKQKVIAALIVVAAFLGVGSYGYYKAHELAGVTAKLNAQLQKANLDLGKAQTEVGDANAKVKELDKDLQSAIKARDEKATAYSQLYAEYKKVLAGTPQTPGTTTGPAKCNEFMPGRLYIAQSVDTALGFDLPIEFTFPFNEADVSCNLDTVEKNDIAFWPRMNSKLDLHLRIMGQLVQTVSPEGAINMYARLYNVDKDGNKLGEFKLTKFETVVEDQRAPHFQWWAPHVDVAGFAGWNGNFVLGGSLGFSVSGYGLTKNDLDWRFLRVGLTLADKIGVDFSPVLWNVGDHIPLLSNLWVGPVLTYRPGVLGAGALFGVVL